MFRIDVRVYTMPQRLRYCAIYKHKLQPKLLQKISLDETVVVKYAKTDIQVG
jgi:hypothetical protein